MFLGWILQQTTVEQDEKNVDWIKGDNQGKASLKTY